MTMETLDNIEKIEEIDIQKYFQVLKRRWLPALGVCALTVTGATLYALSLKPTYRAEGSVMIKSNRTSSLTGVSEDLGRLEALTQNNNPLDTQTRIVTSNPVLQETITALNLRDEKGEMLPVSTLAGQLYVEGIKGSDVLLISYTDPNPEKAANIVNTVIDKYIQQNVLANQGEAQTARKFLLEQLPKAESSVKKAELELRRFKEQHRIIALDEEANAAVGTINKLEEQISQTQAQLANITARLATLRAEAQVEPQQAVISAQLSQTPGVQKVLAQLQEAESQLALEKTRFQSRHPSVVSWEEKVAALRNLLNQRTTEIAGNKQQVQQGNLQLGELRQGLIAEITRVEAERVGLEQQIISLSNKFSVYKQRADYLPQLEQIQRELERRLKAAQSTYETLLTKIQEINVAENQKIPNARIISAALVPDVPQGPRKMLFIVGGAAAGVLLGLMAAFGLDLIDRSVKTVKEARAVLKYTLLGVIPAVGKHSKHSSSVAGVNRPIPQIIGRDIPEFPVGNAYQILQANLKFLCSDTQLKSIVVTSSVSKEGKSEVAANLAVAMASTGRRVLLVDADMRHPIQHHTWGLTNAVGLSNVIIDRLNLNAAVQEVLPNLDVLCSGVVPPNPIALLDSQRMATLLDNFTQKYDFVIFDTPAVVGTADAAILSDLTDGILLVVRPGVVDLDSANAAKEYLTQSNQKVLGIVVNGLNVKNEPNSYLYYTKEAIESVTSPNEFSPIKQTMFKKIPKSEVSESQGEKS
ncbi:MAG: polysaccharide biosynthesis tyrosine autokinase [Richelia sp. RM2_1_2]|nr:polysaccharide biosynthesis tyrosine autokinase [Richelia sp. SM1_7_0]NJN09694.1 polysaccharide biosynthesis tyrosine autokinase [Richelia sp. RM1_1_1]NJO27997.1 polysaccharide biosynthesis tyrosine autokinase [Richelia sp. SL_2_1]NJO59796.1 polysaccharide biosynthesis tyrosine autokinase [Richelia sp. RM2_1_2]